MGDPRCWFPHSAVLDKHYRYTEYYRYGYCCYYRDLCYCLSSVSIASNLAVSERILNDGVYEVDMAILTLSCRFC